MKTTRKKAKRVIVPKKQAETHSITPVEVTVSPVESAKWHRKIT
jgi:hypothetical protein